ncbi:MAG: DNA-binding protein [Acidobacteria bacterium]|nr:MAG: DNA-binding protein [Acidobacteriota bacterium]
MREAEAAAYIGVSAATLPSWRSRGLGPRYVKLNRAVRYLEADLDAFLEAHTVTPAGDE